VPVRADAGGGLMGVLSYLWQNVLPPSLWTLLGIGIAHWRQMSAHRVTQIAMLSEHTAAKRAHIEARTARTIVADLYKHQTGLHHPAAPREGM
jgi:hypothetical protein